MVLEYEGLVKRFGAITALDGVSFTAVQLRRTMLPSLVALGLLLDIGVPLVLLDVAPTFAWAWTAVVLVGAVAGAGGQLAVELEHYHLRLAPLRPLPALLWLSAIPAVHRVVSTELAWLPVLFAPRVTTGIWATGVVLIPCLILLAEATGSAAVVATDGWHTRIGLKLAFAALGVLPAAAVWIAAMALGWSPPVVAPVVAAALLVSAALYFDRAAHRIRPPRTSFMLPVTR